MPFGHPFRRAPHAQRPTAELKMKRLLTETRLLLSLGAAAQGCTGGSQLTCPRHCGQESPGLSFLQAPSPRPLWSGPPSSAFRALQAAVLLSPCPAERPAPSRTILASTSSHQPSFQQGAAHLLLLGLDPGREVRDVIVGHRGGAHRVLEGGRASVLPAQPCPSHWRHLASFQRTARRPPPSPGQAPASGTRTAHHPVGSGTRRAPPWSQKGDRPREPRGKTRLAKCRSRPKLGEATRNAPPQSVLLWRDFPGTER